MTFLPRVVALSLLGLAACGGDGSEPYTLTISGNAVTYAAAQDGDGAWQQLTLDASGTATFEVTRGYHGAATLCGPFLLVRYDAGGDEPWQACSRSTATSVQVSGTLTPATAQVWLGYSLSTRTDGTYRVSDAPGRRDLVAFSGTRVLLQRDLQLDTDLTIDLDVDADGVPLTTLTPTVTGNGAAAFTAYTEIVTANGTYAQTSSSAFAVVPTAQRVPGDRVVIGASLDGAEGNQIVQRELLDETTPALTFEPLPELAVDRTGLRWGEGWDYAAVTYRPALTLGTETNLVATPAWSAASGASSIPLVDGSALPGVVLPEPWPATGTALRVQARAGIGDLSGDYRANFVDAALTW